MFLFYLLYKQRYECNWYSFDFTNLNCYSYRVFHLSVASQDWVKNEQYSYAFIKIYHLIRIFYILIVCQKSDING